MDALTPDLVACFEAGAEARARGRSCAENPFARDSEAGREWQAGWRATLDLDEEDDPSSDRLCKHDEVPAG